MKDKLKNKFLGINEVSDDKQKPLIMLLAWLVFIGVVFGYVRTNNASNSNNNTNTNNEVKVTFDSLSDIFNKYNNYKYDITITDLENNVVSFNGYYIDNIDTGSKKKLNNTINYRIEDNIVKNTDTNEVIENLYENYLSYFFVPSNIYKYVNYLKVSEKEDGNVKKYNYEYIYNDKNITFEIVTSKSNIDNIKFVYDNLKYNIKYSVME